MNWLPRAMHLLRDELKNIQVTISSDYSPDLAEALVRGRLDVAFLRAEPTFDLCYEVVDREPLIVLMPSDHRLTSREAIHPRELVGEIFIGGSNKATVLRAVTEDFLRRSGLDWIMGWTTWRWPCPWLRPPAGWRLCPLMRRICCRGPWSAVRWRVKRQ
ncbi:MAG: LysR substrate-binding domain-containing protein [Methylocella sp.]